MAKKENRDELVFVEDILECIEKITLYTKNLTQTEFESNTEKIDAVIRRIEIIGEATKNISENTRKNYSQIPWREMAGMRDIVIHEYFGISMELVWQTITLDLPNLKKQIKQVFNDFEHKKK